MWIGPLHDRDFASRALRSIEDDKDSYGTWTRMHGMLTVASEVRTFNACLGVISMAGT